MADRRQKSGKKANATNRPGETRVVYAEFGNGATERATERAVPDLPPNQQDVRVQASRKGRGGKTVTVVSGLQHSPDSLKVLLKKLKAQCGTGGTVRDDTLELQGDAADRLVEALVKLGYRAKRSGG